MMEPKDYPFPVFGLLPADIEAFWKTFQALSAQYPATFSTAVLPTLDEYEMIKGYSDFEVREAIRLNEKAEVLFCHLKYLTGSGRHRGWVQEYHNFAMAEMDQDFGHVFIKHESFEEKVNEFFHPVEIDFEEDKTFSRRFYILARDEMKARMAINDRFRKTLRESTLHHLHLEIHGRIMLVTTGRPVGPDDALQLAGFVSKVAAQH